VKHEFQVTVMLKEGLVDPQGKAVEDALPAMGWEGVTGVRVGKVVHLTVEAEDDRTAAETASEVARRLLSNPVIEDVSVTPGPQTGEVEP
jgi:phosphoribosylformylglycinamidine synthase